MVRVRLCHTTLTPGAMTNPWGNDRGNAHPTTMVRVRLCHTTLTPNPWGNDKSLGQ